MSRPPRVELDLVAGVAPPADASPVLVTGPLTMRVNVPEQDRWLLQSSQYEVAFFIDGEFVSEEERGYVPLSWKWDPANLAPGRHMLTVNVSGFAGQVGVKSVPLQVAPKGTAQ
jgi:hypothetical protein